MVCETGLLHIHPSNDDKPLSKQVKNLMKFKGTCVLMIVGKEGEKLMGQSSPVFTCAVNSAAPSSERLGTGGPEGMRFLWKP